MMPSKTVEPDIVRKQQAGKLQPPIASFLESYLGNTLLTYRAGVLDFFDFIIGKRMRGKKGATPADMEKYETFVLKYLKEKRDYSADFLRYIKHLNESGVPPHTAGIRYVAVREFLRRYDVEIDDKRLKDARRLKPKGGRRTNLEYADRQILSEILCHTDVRSRAFLLFLISSGCRLGEAMNVKWNDLTFPDRTKYPDKPVQVFIRTSKTGFSRKTYISHECEAALIEWKKVSDDFQVRSKRLSANLKNPKKDDNGKVFPFAKTGIYEMWNKALDDSGHYNKDNETGRVRLNIHRLRNYFAVQVSSAAGNQMSEVLLGHTDSYQGAYSGRPESEMEAAYLKAEPFLTVATMNAPGFGRELESQALKITSQDQTIAKLQERISELEQERNREIELTGKNLLKVPMPNGDPRDWQAYIDAAIQKALKPKK
jgi:integrase